MSIDYEMNHEDAERQLRDMIARACPTIELHSVRISKDLGERAFLRFACTLSVGDRSYQTEYSCGSLVPMLAYCRDGDEWKRNFPGLGARKRDHIESARGCRRVGSGISLWDDERRQAVREQYEPDRFDVLSCLLLDCARVDGYDDWADWAEDMGAFSGDAVRGDDVRKWQRDFQKIKTESLPFLHHTFGAGLEKAMDLAGYL